MNTVEPEVADVVLIGGGIMSATLGAMLSTLEPQWRIVLVERAADIATESSGPWNNAGTGHSGYCELNYMPDPDVGAAASAISEQFHLSRQWWAYLVEQGLLDPATFVHGTPHMDVVFGDRDVTYLRRRFETLNANPLFADLEFSDDPATIARWAPLVMDGRDPVQHVAATRHPAGTDVDFGALTHGLTRIITSNGGEVRLGHEVRRLRQEADGTWLVTGRYSGSRNRFQIHARHVFVGAGGFALWLLQRAHVPEVRGYGVLPVGAAFLRCARPEVVAQHDAKVYGQAAIGAPPMSVPHLDKRVVDGDGYLMFGPYATFSTKLLKAGKLTDFFTTLRWHNLHVLAAAAAQSLPLVRYLITELLTPFSGKIKQLQRYYPGADPRDWELVPAGQRAQLVTPDAERIGALRSGTELVASRDGTIAGLLGASPGASTAVPIMIELLQRCFPEQWAASWQERMDSALANHDTDTRLGL
ncbi:malate dehydrogenase (quinone) [Mycobacterium sp. CBMA293]|uniref:malate dehydrogenase (quinone) n=1 Tax=unclassified Mycolicibacterium TaxID=2636767 RepID=UPI0012DCA894|nr:MULTISPECIES: malate dehydrogenase (quinone) [unclassified Mycolicibacterium]MUL49983.1 malate dehydrogenase (quinone) [Mycolicibacterium sp. CBMA 360]MUL61570.1 malate dehydrogenase (quinone) [Mycolicibacterium sp. CBMA 335]MUL74305.1 malate dehydrogenase (quinone) [Mycolicibacterium sp. CBMA 311]MUL96583.1 malate dehydrogenase (quinone) [Mycolicibacterium sp. CBMA 230]MUM04259.1 malate dehydrogenase (quinone) [Mycolicibacterium sp. CBMA 213]